MILETERLILRPRREDDAEELYKYDSIMGTNISGFCPENDTNDYDDGD